jgi:hypothetical protein
MITLKEAAPAELAAVRRRAIRSYAMGDIDEASCAQVTTKIDELTQLIAEIPGKKGDQ